MCWPVVFVVKYRLMRMAAMSKETCALDALKDDKTYVLESLHEFKSICEPVLDIEIRHSYELCKTHTLRDHLDELDQLLVSGEYVENAAIGGWITGAFASVAGNFDPRVLRDAINALHSLTYWMIFYEHQYDKVVDLGLNPGDGTNA